MLYIYQNNEFKGTEDKSLMQTTDVAFLFLIQQYK